MVSCLTGQHLSDAVTLYSKQIADLTGKLKEFEGQPNTPNIGEIKRVSETLAEVQAVRQNTRMLLQSISTRLESAESNLRLRLLSAGKP